MKNELSKFCDFYLINIKLYCFANCVVKKIIIINLLKMDETIFNIAVYLSILYLIIFSIINYYYI